MAKFFVPQGSTQPKARQPIIIVGPYEIWKEDIKDPRKAIPESNQYLAGLTAVDMYQRRLRGARVFHIHNPLKG